MFGCCGGISQVAFVRCVRRMITGITGAVSIDEFGDRISDYSLLDMNATGSYEVTTQI